MQQVLEILRLPQVIGITGLSRSTIYNSIASGTFPPPFSLGPRAIGFLRSSVEAWMEARIAGSSEEEMKRLVSELNETRGAKKRG